MSSEFFLEVAGITVRISSSLPPLEEVKSYRYIKEFFLNERPEKIDIDIEVKIETKLPSIGDKENIFKVQYRNRLGDWRVNWGWSKKDGRFLLEGSIWESPPIPYVVYINEDFTRGVAYISFSLDYSSGSWQLHHIIHGPMQMIFIYYLAKNRLGVIVHSTGVEDKGEGLLFTGHSGAGKSTIARIWHKTSNAIVLNDDRIIIRETSEGFVLYRALWGGVSSYLSGQAGYTTIKKLFVIYQSRRNEAELLGPKEAFSEVFPCIFPVFWDKKCLEFTGQFLLKLVQAIPVYKLGFTKDERVIKYIRSEVY